MTVKFENHDVIRIHAMVSINHTIILKLINIKLNLYNINYYIV